jgi:hypothetical protein
MRSSPTLTFAASICSWVGTGASGSDAAYCSWSLFHILSVSGCPGTGRGLIDGDWRVAVNRHWGAAGCRFTAEWNETMRAADFSAVEGLPKMLIMANPCASVAAIASVEYVARLRDRASRRRVSFLDSESLLLRRCWPTELEVHTEHPTRREAKGVTSPSIREAPVPCHAPERQRGCLFGTAGIIA